VIGEMENGLRNRQRAGRSSLGLRIW